MLILNFQRRGTHEIGDEGGDSCRSKSETSQSEIAVRPNSPSQFGRKLEIHAWVERNLLGQFVGMLCKAPLPSIDPVLGGDEELERARGQNVLNAKRKDRLALAIGALYLGPTKLEPFACFDKISTRHFESSMPLTISSGYS